MGLRESDPSSVACSICLEIVADGGDRSTARLQCGHEFHLDCIGSAFNAKGVMQCPNCRKVEKGNWLFANGFRSLPPLSFDDWTRDEDLYELSYAEMSFGVHWCPFGRLPRVPPSFESGSRIAGSSFVSSLVPPYTTTNGPRTHVRDHYQHRNNSQGLRGPVYPVPRRSGAASGGLPPVGPTPVSLPDQASYYLFPPAAAASSSRSLQERDRFASFSVLPVDRESGWWGPPPPPPPPPHSSRTSDSSNRVGFWYQSGSDRPSSQPWRTEASSYRAPHGSRHTRH